LLRLPINALCGSGVTFGYGEQYRCVEIIAWGERSVKNGNPE